MRRPTSGTFVMVALLVCAAVEARAGKVEPEDTEIGGWWVPVGINLGLSAHEDAANGTLIGAEASIVHVAGAEGAGWFGAYADVRYDTGPDAIRLSIGPELGYTIVGVDGGMLIDRDGGGTHFGYTGRALLTIGVIGLYVRVNYVPDPAGTSIDFGVLLKLPLPLARDEPR
jgi:hypothetical protein